MKHPWQGKIGTQAVPYFNREDDDENVLIPIAVGAASCVLFFCLISIVSHLIPIAIGTNF